MIFFLYAWALLYRAFFYDNNIRVDGQCLKLCRCNWIFEFVDVRYYTSLKDKYIWIIVINKQFITNQSCFGILKYGCVIFQLQLYRNRALCLMFSWRKRGNNSRLMHKPGQSQKIRARPMGMLMLVKSQLSPRKKCRRQNLRKRSLQISCQQLLRYFISWNMTSSCSFMSLGQCHVVNRCTCFHRFFFQIYFENQCYPILQ